jgi:UDPglucose 6-dehydrogenase
MEISVIGSGYVGLVTGVGFARKGHNVVCIDSDKDKVRLINRGISPFYDDGLGDALVTCTKEEGCLKASCDYEHILDSVATFVCVGTPTDGHRRPDLSFLRSSAKGIGQVLREKDGYQLVVVRSTVVPGTTEDLVVPLLEEYSGKKAGTHFGVAMNPEFLQEGRALSDFLSPSRIIVGQYDERSGDVIEELYRDFAGPVVRTDIRTAEMMKLASNTFLATKISFMNEIGNLCKKLGIDVYEVARGMGYDYRIGPHFLNAGIGYGGSCLPKDVEALVFGSEELGLEADILKAVARVNTTQALRIVDLAVAALDGVERKRVAVLGLAFKPGVDDIRHAPAVGTIHELLRLNAEIKVYDPMAMAHVEAVFGDVIQYGQNVAETIENAECVLILTEWDDFKDEQLYRGKVVIDGRRALDPQKAREACSYYEGICW